MVAVSYGSLPKSQVPELRGIRMHHLLSSELSRLLKNTLSPLPQMNMKNRLCENYPATFSLNLVNMVLFSSNADPDLRHLRVSGIPRIQ